MSAVSKDYVDRFNEHLRKSIKSNFHIPYSCITESEQRNIATVETIGTVQNPSLATEYPLYGYGCNAADCPDKAVKKQIEFLLKLQLEGSKRIRTLVSLLRQEGLRRSTERSTSTEHRLRYGPDTVHPVIITYTEWFIISYISDIILNDAVEQLNSYEIFILELLGDIACYDQDVAPLIPFSAVCVYCIAVTASLISTEKGPDIQQLSRKFFEVYAQISGRNSSSTQYYWEDSYISLCVILSEAIPPEYFLTNSYTRSVEQTIEVYSEILRTKITKSMAAIYNDVGNSQDYRNMVYSLFISMWDSNAGRITQKSEHVMLREVHKHVGDIRLSLDGYAEKGGTKLSDIFVSYIQFHCFYRGLLVDYNSGVTSPWDYLYMPSFAFSRIACEENKLMRGDDLLCRERIQSDPRDVKVNSKDELESCDVYLGYLLAPWKPGDSVLVGLLQIYTRTVLTKMGMYEELEHESMQTACTTPELDHILDATRHKIHIYAQPDIVYAAYFSTISEGVINMSVLECDKIDAMLAAAYKYLRSAMKLEAASWLQKSGNDDLDWLMNLTIDLTIQRKWNVT